MAHILVTGGAGYVGSVCSEQLLRLGHAVTVLDDLSTGFADAVPRGAALIEANIGDRSRVETIVARQCFDAVFHFAAKALIPESMTDPGIFFQANVASSIVFLEALRAAGVSNFVFSSSAAVYGTPSEVPIDEEAPKNPVNSYGRTKLMLEEVLEWYARAYGWSVFAFRYFNAAGATGERGERHDPETHIVPLLLEASIGQRDVFTIYGDDYATEDGTCLRDYVHVLDIAKAHIRALERMKSPGMRSYNIGLGHTYSVRQMVAAVEKITGKPIAVRVAPRRAGDPPVLCASPRRICQELNWRPEHSSLDEILRSAWHWKQKQAGFLSAAARRSA